MTNVDGSFAPAVQCLDMSDPADLEQSLRAEIAHLGFSFAGVADVTPLRSDFRLSESVRGRFPIALSLGRRLLDSVLEDIKSAPTPLYFHHYRQTNAFLDRAAFLLSGHIQSLGFQALPIPASQILDWHGQTGHLSHKHVARNAGLGWIGRNNLLVHPEFGARFRLVTVLTDLPLAPAVPLDFGCGSCRACISACPADAIRERPEDFDHLGCFEQLKEFRNKGLVGQFICGVCVKVCGGRNAAAGRSR